MAPTRTTRRASAGPPEDAALIYRLYGLRVHSPHPIPSLPAPTSAAPPDVVVHFAPAEQWPQQAAVGPWVVRYASSTRRPYADSGVRVCSRPDGSWFHLRYAGGVEFLVDRIATTIFASWRAPFTVHDAAVYLLGPVFGLVLRLRGITCLHGSAIDLGGRAVVVAGPGGAGKSTTAAMFAKYGHAILSDDVVALADGEDAWFVEPAYARIGLWSDSVDTLFGGPDRLPLQTPNWEKRYLDLTGNGYRFQSEPQALEAVYVLDGREPDAGAPRVAALAPRDRVARLIENAYVSYLLDDAMRARDFDALARIAAHRPVRRLVAHADPAQLPRLRDAVLRDLDRRGCGSPSG